MIQSLDEVTRARLPRCTEEIDSRLAHVTERTVPGDDGGVDARQATAAWVWQGFDITMFVS
jgi:hypothetical protein